MEKHMHVVRHWGPLVARLLVGVPFVLAGVNKLNNMEGTAAAISSVGLPMPEVLVILTIILEIAAGAAIVLGWQFVCAAGALILFTLLASFLFHGPNSWGEQTQMLMFMKNMGIVAALIYMMAYGPGKCMVLGKKKHHHE